MFGAVPQMIVDIGIVAGVFSALMAALALLWKTPPVRWFRTQLSESLGEWFEARVESANKSTTNTSSTTSGRTVTRSRSTSGCVTSSVPWGSTILRRGCRTRSIGTARTRTTTQPDGVRSEPSRMG